MRSRISAALLVILLILTAVCLAEENSLRGYNKAEGGYQYVQVGSYPYEEDGTAAPVVWRVLSVEDQQAILLSDKILDCKSITFVANDKDRENHNYPDLTDFRESDLYQWLNNEMFNTLFQNDAMSQAVTETDQGVLWLLSYDELANTKWGFDKSVWKHNYKTRRAYPTPYAIAQGVKQIFGGQGSPDGSAPWWSRTLRYKKGKKAWMPGADGHISVGVIGRTGVGVRPCLTLDLTNVSITSGSGTEQAPFVLTYRASSVFDADYIRIASASVSDVNTKSAGNEQEMILSFIGDLSIGDATQSRASEASLTNVIRKQGYAWPFSLVVDYFMNDDYTFANLEVVFTEREALKSSKKYNMIGQPDFVNVLLEGGIDVVNTVNNHCFDFTEKGYQDMLATLDEAKLNHFGTIYPGMPQESDILGIAEVKGIRIGMIGMSYPDEKRDFKRFEARIKKLKEEMGCQLIVCSMHWGREEHMTTILNTQFSFARKLIDAGADVIWGHHPHVLQPVFFYKGKPVMFSTGNFIFGTMGQVNPATGIFQLHYDVSGGVPVLTEMSVVPCETGKRGDYRPFELEDIKARSTCWGYMINKKKVAKMDNLPASFANTGRVLVTPEGALLDAE